MLGRFFFELLIIAMHVCIKFCECYMDWMRVVYFEFFNSVCEN